jgi:hypothetical protein
MRLKAKKNGDKSKEPFMGILTSKQASEGAAKFRGEAKEKIKPILYHDVQEKNEIEAKLISEMPEEERFLISHTLMDLFANVRRHSSVKSE